MAFALIPMCSVLSCRPHPDAKPGFAQQRASNQERRRLPYGFTLQRELQDSDSVIAIAAMQEFAARSLHKAFPADLAT
jgi:hypothetical protein